jgi:hypothetical protein
LTFVDVSNNQLESLDSFSHLVSLQELNADSNRISTVEFNGPMSSLQILSLNENKVLAHFDFDWMTGLRYLSLDKCGVVGMVSTESAFRLEFLSVQGQLGAGLNVDFQSFINLRELKCGGLILP